MLLYCIWDNYILKFALINTAHILTVPVVCHFGQFLYAYLLAFASNFFISSKLRINLLNVKELPANARKYAYDKMAKMAYYWYCQDVSSVYCPVLPFKSLQGTRYFSSKSAEVKSTKLKRRAPVAQVKRQNREELQRL